MNSRQFYQNVAQRHRLFYADWPATVRQEGAWLDALLRPRGVQRVLDCTCGIGTQAIGLTLAGYRVTASDLSAHNLAEAQRGAAELGATVDWRQADVRRLDQAIVDQFDAVLSLGNSLPHLKSEASLEAALVQMKEHVRPGGLILVGQRDWDAVRQQRPHFNFRHDHHDTPGPGQRTILFDLWRYDDPLVMCEVFFMPEDPLTGGQVEVNSLRYRMWQRSELVDLMEEAGIINIRQVEHPWEMRLMGQRL